MIKLIIFDFSGVCYTEEEEPYMGKFSHRHKIGYKSLMEFYMPLILRAQKGEFGGREVIIKVLDRFNIKDDPDKIIKDMMAVKKEKHDTLKLVKHLSHKYKIAYFTNYDEDFFREFDRRFKPAQYFDYGIVSYQILSKKPEPEGFVKIMKQFKVHPEEVVFTDDNEANLVNAKALGINTIHFKDIEYFKKELKKLGVDE
jgi:HAD superfamily hydrolase (TIGR01509 family)